MMIEMRDHTDSTPQTDVDGQMTCEEFQEQLPALVGSGIREHEHLQTCLRCNALLDELEYISEIAKGLLPSYDPSDKVWAAITKNLPAQDGDEPTNGFHREPGT